MSTVVEGLVVSVVLALAVIGAVTLWVVWGKK